MSTSLRRPQVTFSCLPSFRRLGKNVILQLSQLLPQQNAHRHSGSGQVEGACALGTTLTSSHCGLFCPFEMIPDTIAQSLVISVRLSIGNTVSGFSLEIVIDVKSLTTLILTT